MKLDIRVLLLVFSYLVVLSPVRAEAPPVQLKKVSQKERSASSEQRVDYSKKTLNRKEIRQQKRQARKAKRRKKNKRKFWRTVGVVFSLVALRLVFTPLSSTAVLSLGGLSIGPFGFISIILLFIGLPLWLKNEKKPMNLNDVAVSMINQQYPEIPEDITDLAVVDQWEKEIRRAKLLRYLGYGLCAIFLWLFILGLLFTRALGFQPTVALITLLMLIPIGLSFSLILKAKDITDEIIASYEKPAED
ncbi:MAG: hypothetical protein AAFP19_20770 [Bacteroidota bacterium]